jgi:DNA repair protein RecN (Recombination protein N)
MLESLHIQNYALIENLDLSLRQGFSVITGETGAGKSIILGALGMLLGQRTDVKSIKPGASRCVVEGIFGLKDCGMESFFEQNNLDFDGAECIVRRELTEAGKSRAFINDSPVAVSLLKELGPHLIDIHSQHQNLLLGEKHFQLDVLDTVSDDRDLLARYQAIFKTWQTSEVALRAFRKKVEEERENMDFLKFEWKEIDSAHLEENEQQELETEMSLLDHTEEIKQGLFETDTLLSAEEVGISTKMAACVHTMESLARVYGKMEPLIERLRSCSIELDDIAQEISKELEQIHFDPQRQLEVNERLNSIYALEKKYRCDSVTDLLKKAAELRSQLSNLEDSDERMSQMEKENENLLNETLKAAGQLSEVRRNTAPKVEQEMESRLENWA